MNCSLKAEIPDLNTFSSNLAKRLVGKTLANINAIVSRQSQGAESVLKEMLKAEILVANKRLGKELHLEFTNK